MSKKGYHHVHLPDQIDCDARIQNLYDDFGLVVRIEVTFKPEGVGAVIRCYRPDAISRVDVVVQSRFTQSLKSTKPLWSGIHAALYDCYLQCDRQSSAKDAIPPYGVADLPLA